MEMEQKATKKTCKTWDHETRGSKTILRAGRVLDAENSL